jgi:hypothetical protein
MMKPARELFGTITVECSVGEKQLLAWVGDKQSQLCTA